MQAEQQAEAESGKRGRQKRTSMRRQAALPAIMRVSAVSTLPLGGKLPEAILGAL